MEHIEKITQSLQLNQLDSIPQLKIITQKTTLKPSVFILAVGLFFVLISFLINISPLITGIVCVLIPGYLSLQTIGTKVEKNYIRFLVYWVLFGLNEILAEPILNIIFHSTFIMIFKVALTVALLHPNFNFSLFIYDRFIRKLLNQSETILKEPVHQNERTPLNENKKQE